MSSEFREFGPHRSYRCAICQQSTDKAIQGNAEASKWRVYHRHKYPNMESYEWRCNNHMPFKMRKAVTAWTNEYGDYCMRLECGHTIIMILRGLPYEPNQPETALDKPIKKRCFICGDEEQKAKETNVSNQSTQ